MRLNSLAKLFKFMLVSSFFCTTQMTQAVNRPLPLVKKLAVACAAGGVFYAKQVAGSGYICSKATITRINETHSTWECTDSSYRERCFHEMVQVYRLEAGEVVAVAIGDLKEGDQVLDHQGQLTEVLSMMHDVKANALDQLVSLYDQDQNLIVRLTPEHLLFDSEGNSKFANGFRMGDQLLARDGSVVKVASQEISAVEEDDKTRLVAPLTQSGTLLVGPRQIAASCYAHVSDHDLAHDYIQRLHALDPQGGFTYSVFEGFLMRGLCHFGLARLSQPVGS